MSRSERTYHELFTLLRETPPTASLTPEEVQSLIEERSGKPASGRSGLLPGGRMITGIAALLAVSLVGIWLLRSPAPAPESAHTILPARQGTIMTPQKNIAPRQETRPEDIATTAAIPSVAGARESDRLPGTPRVIPATSRSRPATHRQSASPAAPTMHGNADAITIGASDPSSDHPAMQPEGTTFPMLELSAEELGALGVTIADGEIRTIGEEYYTLVTEQQRVKFAAMGIDTTTRTGIVRKQLTIDTSGITTTKYSWTRVERYSRIAPIIALGTYPKDEHTVFTMINSFDRSPIIDAKHSIGSMEDVLATMFARDNADSASHDSTRTDPARILVPVHIRLGDEPILGGTKRRGADIILWYYPTPEFAAALPARYRISLQKEMNAIADVVQCNMPPLEACRQMTGEPLLLNYCKRTSGALSGLSVSPNPARGAVTVRYTLGAERTVAVLLYGIRGEYVARLLPAASADAGTHSANVELGDVKAGAYMVVLRSDRGEQVSERLIVQ